MGVSQKEPTKSEKRILISAYVAVLVGDGSAEAWMSARPMVASWKGDSSSSIPTITKVEKMTKPPGVQTLHEWGQHVFPSGKMSGMTLARVYEREPGYMKQVENRSAVYRSLRSFQQYCRTRREVSPKPMPRSERKETGRSMDIREADVHCTWHRAVFQHLLRWRR